MQGRVPCLAARSSVMKAGPADALGPPLPLGWPLPHHRGGGNQVPCDFHAVGFQRQSGGKQGLGWSWGCACVARGSASKQSSQMHWLSMPQDENGPCGV